MTTTFAADTYHSYTDVVVRTKHTRKWGNHRHSGTGGHRTLDKFSTSKFAHNTFSPLCYNVVQRFLSSSIPSNQVFVHYFAGFIAAYSP
jgi:hypothetical protein